MTFWFEAMPTPARRPDRLLLLLLEAVHTLPRYVPYGEISESAESGWVDESSGNGTQ